MSVIGDNIKNKRTELGLTLREVADRAGVSKQTIQRYETGTISNIPSDKVEKVATALNVTPAYLMGWEYEFKDAPKQSDASIRRLAAYKKAFAHNKAIAEISSNLETLNTEGINKVLEYTNILVGNPEYVQQIKDKEPDVKEPDVKEPELYAAHERTDIEVTDEMRRHDDDIMNSDDF